MVQLVAELEMALMVGVIIGCFVWLSIVWPAQPKVKERKPKWNLKSE